MVDPLGQGFRFIIFRSSEGGRHRSRAAPDHPDPRFAARCSGAAKPTSCLALGATSWRR